MFPKAENWNSPNSRKGRRGGPWKTTPDVSLLSISRCSLVLCQALRGRWGGSHS